MKNTYGGTTNRSPKYSPQRSDQTRDREQSLARWVKIYVSTAYSAC